MSIILRLSHKICFSFARNQSIIWPLLECWGEKQQHHGQEQSPFQYLRASAPPAPPAGGIPPGSPQPWRRSAGAACGREKNVFLTLFCLNHTVVPYLEQKYSIKWTGTINMGFLFLKKEIVFNPKNVTFLKKKTICFVFKDACSPEPSRVFSVFRLLNLMFKPSNDFITRVRKWNCVRKEVFLKLDKCRALFKTWLLVV